MDEQEAAVQVKKQDKGSDRGKNWSDEEVYDLIDIWSDDTVQEQLEGSRRNQHIYSKISERMKEKGYTRTMDQCRQKMKKLRKDYKDVVDNNNETGRKRKTFKFFEEIDAIFGCRPATKPNVTVCSDKGISIDEGDDDDPISPISSNMINPELLADTEDDVR